MTHDIFVNKKCPKLAESYKKCQQIKRKVLKRQDFIVSVLLSAHTENVGVSRKRDFYIGISTAYRVLADIGCLILIEQ